MLNGQPKQETAISRDSVSFNSYEEMAEYYFEYVDTKPFNAYYERPATISLLPDVNGKKVMSIVEKGKLRALVLLFWIIFMLLSEAKTAMANGLPIRYPGPLTGNLMPVEEHKACGTIKKSHFQVIYAISERKNF